MNAPHSKSVAFIALLRVVAKSAHAAKAGNQNGVVFDPEFGAVASKAFARGFTPEIAVAVVHDGKFIYADGFGYADLARWERVTPRTSFAIGSLVAAIILARADDVHLGTGLADERRGVLVVLGSDARGKKHLVALDEEMSESETNWYEILRDLMTRCLRSPHLATADGANDF